MGKQWKHWCQSAGLKPESGERKPMWCWAYLVGHGRRWRVNCYGEFQMSVPLNDFDRWANSVQSTEPVTPRSKSEMLAVVSRLRRLTPPDDLR